MKLSEELSYEQKMFIRVINSVFINFAVSSVIGKFKDDIIALSSNEIETKKYWKHAQERDRKKALLYKIRLLLFIWKYK